MRIILRTRLILI